MRCTAHIITDINGGPVVTVADTEEVADEVTDVVQVKAAWAAPAITSLAESVAHTTFPHGAAGRFATRKREPALPFTGLDTRAC